MSGFPRTPNWHFEPGSGVLTLYTAYTTGLVPTDAVTVTGKLAEALVDCLSWIVEQESAALHAPREPEPEPERVEPWQLHDWADKLTSIASDLREAAES